METCLKLQGTRDQQVNQAPVSLFNNSATVATARLAQEMHRWILTVSNFHKSFSQGPFYRTLLTRSDLFLRLKRTGNDNLTLSHTRECQAGDKKSASKNVKITHKALRVFMTVIAGCHSNTGAGILSAVSVCHFHALGSLTLCFAVCHYNFSTMCHNSKLSDVTSQ